MGSRTKFEERCQKKVCGCERESMGVQPMVYLIGSR